MMGDGTNILIVDVWLTRAGREQCLSLSLGASATVYAMLVNHRSYIYHRRQPRYVDLLSVGYGAAIC